MQNGERDVILRSIIVHATEPGDAQGFKEAAHSELRGKISLEEIIFSLQICSEWSDTELWKKLLSKNNLINPEKV
jgi:6-pyruvoyltetrahydropterin/6-carboxytetrahydropterin synthase